MNKLGMHIHGIKPGIIEAVELLQPRTITIMDPSAQEIRDIYAVANPVTVVRKYEDGKNFQQVDPEWWAKEYYRMVGDAASDRLVALGMNEPFGHDAQSLCAPFDEWNRAFIERCRELGPMDGGALAMATGNWTGADDRYKITDDFPVTGEIARFFLPHEYCWPTLGVGVPWYTLRYRAWIKDLEAIGREDFSFIVSEAGLTQAIIAGRPDEGWRSGGPEGVTEDSYINTIDWYNARLCEDWRVLGCCLYDWAGSHYGWETFEQLGLEQRIYQIQAPEPPEPPEPPNGDDMDIKVVDKEYKERDFEWAETKYGVAYRRAEVAPGQKVYRLVELWEKTGTTSLVSQVLDGNSQPIANKSVAFYWSDAPDPPEPATEVYPHDWYRKFVHGPTNVNGDVGPGMGIGAYHGEGEGGPHAVWVRDPNIPSDICEKLGMLAGTFHDHLDQKFKLDIAGEENGGGNGAAPLELKEIVREDYAVSALCIAYPTSVAMNTRGDGRGPGVDEDLHPKDWTHPGGTKMAMVELTTDFDGEEPRTYTLRVYRMLDGASLTNTESETFPPLGAPRERVIYVYVESEGEPPGPPPEDGDLLAAVLRLDANVAKIWEKMEEGYVPPDEPPDPEPEVFHVEFFNNGDLTGPPVYTTTEAPPFWHDWGAGSPAPGVNTDHVSGRWSGSFAFDEAKTYRFNVKTDDGVRLWVDGNLVLDKWYPQSATLYFVEVPLLAGLHEVVLEWYEDGGHATLHFNWE